MSKPKQRSHATLVKGRSAGKLKPTRRTRGDPACGECGRPAEKSCDGKRRRVNGKPACLNCHLDSLDRLQRGVESKNKLRQCPHLRKKLTYVEATIHGKKLCAECFETWAEDQDQEILEQYSLDFNSNKEGEMSKPATRNLSNKEKLYEVRPPTREHVLAALDANHELPLPLIVYPGREGEIAFDLERLKKFCEMGVDDFGDIEGAAVVDCGKDGNYVFLDRGADILAVAHRDTVRPCGHFGWLDFESGPEIFTPVLDDRLGCFVIFDVLERLGYRCDVLFTEGEESGRSTAAYFKPPEGRQYRFIIEFDRKEDDVVLYQYADKDWEAALRKAGFRIGHGTFSDIAVLGHLGACAVNIGCGYKEYHSDKAHASLTMLYEQITRFQTFMAQTAELAFPFDQREAKKKQGGGRYRSPYGMFEGSGETYSGNNGGYSGNGNSSYNNTPKDVRQSRTPIKPAEANIISFEGQRFLVFLDEVMTLDEAGLTASDVGEKETPPKTKECANCHAPVNSDALFGPRADLCIGCQGTLLPEGEVAKN